MFSLKQFVFKRFIFDVIVSFNLFLSVLCSLFIDNSFSQLSTNESITPKRQNSDDKCGGVQ